MKLIVVCVAFAALASAAKKPIAEHFTDFAGEEDIHLITDDDDRPPVNYQGDVMKAKTTSLKTSQGQGKFNYNFETENGISVAQIGKLKDSKTFVVSGSYTYTGADGKRYRVRYTADEFGYHPVTALDDQPEIEIKPQPTLPPVPKLKFSPLTPFLNGNSFNNFNNQNQEDNAVDEVEPPFNKAQQGLKNQQTFGNVPSLTNTLTGNDVPIENSFGQHGNNGLPSSFNTGNGFPANAYNTPNQNTQTGLNAGNAFGSTFSQKGNSGGPSGSTATNGFNPTNAYNTPNQNTQTDSNSGNAFGSTFSQKGNSGGPSGPTASNGFNPTNAYNTQNQNTQTDSNLGNAFGNTLGANGLNNDLNNAVNNELNNGFNVILTLENSKNGLNNNNGFNTITGFAQYDRTGKSLEQTDLIFNQNFISAPVGQKQEDANRLYLPPKPTYLPPKPTYLPPKPTYLPSLG